MSEEFTVGISIEDGSDFLSRKEIGFSLHDSIFSPFPTLELVYPDISGVALEYGSFMQGIKLHSIFGPSDDFLDNEWKSLGRDTVKEAGSFPRLSGVIKTYAVHKSYFDSRENPKKAFNKKLVSDCVKELFSSEKDLNVEDTKGKIDTYAFEDPYEVVKEILLPAATNGKVRPYVFFRDLNNTLNFCSIDKLLSSSVVATFELKANLSEQDDESAVITGFLPFNEKGNKVYPNMRVTGKFLDKDLSLTKEESSIATDEKNTIPFLVENKLENAIYFGRQFNPDVEYTELNKGFAASSMNFILDKCLCTIPFNKKCVAGKTIELKINSIDTEGNEKLSETFSGNWLIEQSYHCWDGQSSRPSTKLVLCRTGMKPIKDSILDSGAFKD